MMKLKNVSGRDLAITGVPFVKDGEVVEVSKSEGKRLLEVCKYFEEVKKGKKNKKFKAIEKE